MLGVVKGSVAIAAIAIISAEVILNFSWVTTALSSALSCLETAYAWIQDSPVLKILLLPLVLNFVQSLIARAKDSLFSLILVRIRFSSSAELRSYLQFLAKQTGMSTNTFKVASVRGVGEFETLLSPSSGNSAGYELAVEGVPPLQISHVEGTEASYWFRIDPLTEEDKQRRWWRFPYVFFWDDAPSSVLWDAVPKQVQDFLLHLHERAAQMFPALATATTAVSGARSTTFSENTGWLVGATFSWNAQLLEQVVSRATAYASLVRTRSCPINHLRSDKNVVFVAPPRPIETVVRERDGGDALLADVERFFGRRAWYLENDVPYQRVYLLHGPPGA